MPPLPRSRRIAKWVGLISCGVITALWIGSFRWIAGIVPVNRVRAGQIWLSGGFVCVFTPSARSPWPNGRPDYKGFVNRWDSAYSGQRLTERIGLVGPTQRKSRWYNELRLPLWPLWLAIAIPTAILQLRDRRRKQEIRPSNQLHRVRQERLPVGTSLALSALVFAALLVFIPLTIDALLPLVSLTDGAELGAIPTAPLVAVLFLSVLLPYLGVRFLYPKLRWRIVITDDPHCDSCGYNLNGNESGVCPECATPIKRTERSGDLNKEAAARGENVPR